MVLENEKGRVKMPLTFDRRKHPRYLVEVPLDFEGMDDRAVSTGLTVNASEGGIMTLIGERVDVGAVLNVTLFFRLGYSLKAMETKSVVIWRDDVWKEYIDNYKYGLKFLETAFEEIEKLRELFKNSERQETLYVSLKKDIH